MATATIETGPGVADDPAAPSVQARGIVKRFSGVPALKGVDLSIHPGEVVGLLGENGAGKSTLIKVFSGVHLPDEGTLTVRGEQVTLREPAEALTRGIATVHQHSSLAENLTIAENLVLGRERGTRYLPWWLVRRSTTQAAREIVERVGIELPPLSTLVGELSVAQRQLVEIVRASAEAATLIILDEPTAALNPAEVEELFTIIRRLKSNGVSVLYVSHRLDEIPQICDRAVVLRDGAYVGELWHDDCVPDNIIPMLVGRQLDDLFPDRTTVGDTTVFDGVGLTGKTAKGVDLVVRAGEVVGLTGAVGSGARNVARIIFGADTGSGSMTLHGKKLPFGRPDLATKAGVGYVSGDRKKEGLLPVLSVTRNTTLIAADRMAFAGFIRPGAETKRGLELVKQFDVRAASPNQEIQTLSGGNQQKALLARWAAISPNLLILDEPTLGVDVGARREIYDQIIALAEQGMGVILVSADHAELQGMSHRVLVFDDGRVVAEMPGQAATEEAILRARTRALTDQKEAVR